MPHERIYSITADPSNAMNVQVAWGHPSSPSDTGPGHGNDDGHVMVIVEHPAGPARMACSIEEIKRRIEASIIALAEEGGVAGVADNPYAKERTELAALVMGVVGMENLSYAFGSPLNLLAAQIDRKGCNRMISALRRGRDAAFGRDE